jgi:hypothetical protein
LGEVNIHFGNPYKSSAHSGASWGAGYRPFFVLWVLKMGVANGERANMIRPYQGFYGVCKMYGVMVVLEFDLNFEN